MESKMPSGADSAGQKRIKSKETNYQLKGGKPKGC